MNEYQWFTLARILHVLAIVIWIGGVSMVTVVIIPAIKKMKKKENQMESFEQIEGRFAVVAKVMTIVTGITGFYMIHYLGAWDRYFSVKYWWIHAMTLVWLIFSLILFVLEPFVLHRLFRKYMNENSRKTFEIMHRVHWVLLIFSMLAILGVVAGGHGWFLFA